MFDSYPDSYRKDALDSYHKDSLDSYSNSYHKDAFDSYHKDSLNSYVGERFQHMLLLWGSYRYTIRYDSTYADRGTVRHNASILGNPATSSTLSNLSRSTN